MHLIHNDQYFMSARFDARTCNLYHFEQHGTGLRKYPETFPNVGKLCFNLYSYSPKQPSVDRLKLSNLQVT